MFRFALRFMATVLAFVFLCENGIAQKLIDSRKSSFNTYIYKLTDKEAKRIYAKDLWEVDKTFFHTLVDSFPTDSTYAKKLDQGHYLKTYAEGSKQHFSITSVQNFEVQILNNNTDLCIQVYDLQGNVIPNAKVKVRSKTLAFNKQTQCYVDKKSNQKGLLEVTYNGFTAYYNLQRQYNNSAMRRTMRKVVYGTPVKYVWIPVRYVVFLPIDGVKSIISHWPVGTIYRTQQFFINAIEWIACKIDRYYCDDDNEYSGYLVFNKPKYQPADTVRLKAYVVDKKGRPLRKEVNVMLRTEKKRVKLCQLKPYRDGGYEYKFFLHDSLQLKLDKNYYVWLESNDGDTYIEKFFKYEDYELTKSELSIRTDRAEHYQNDTVRLFVKGTDDNGLNLMDGRLQVLLQPVRVNSFFHNRVFVPDTLMYAELELKPTGETEIVIPPSIFPKVNVRYSVSVRLLTSDNESEEKSLSVDYFYRDEQLVARLLSDSLQFVYTLNGEQKEKLVTVKAYDNFGNEAFAAQKQVPCKVDFNPFFAYYTVSTDSLYKRLDIASQPSLVQCYTERTADSITLVVDNPRGIPFTYNIYKRNRGKGAGYSHSLNIKRRAATKQNYYVSIRYLWGGKINEDTYRIPLQDKMLNVSVTQPPLVYPGQKSKIDILVTDIKGKPVEGVDLTAFSLTKKFGYVPPVLPYLGKERKSKEVINNFHFRDFSMQPHTGLPLDYEAWKVLASVDSIEHFKFIYPGQSIYRFEYYTSDTITQFAPFVMHNGEVQPVHVVYVDGRPVYFSWSTNVQPYSFKGYNGYHEVKLRTLNKVITVDSVYFAPGKKLVMSLNDNLKHKHVKIVEAKPELSAFEKTYLHKYIFPYRNTFGDKLAYVEQFGDVQLLSPRARVYRIGGFAGPFAGPLNLNVIEGYRTSFMHEPNFEYEFAPGLIKMRSVDEKLLPSNLLSVGTQQALSDEVLTIPRIEKMWQDYLDSKRSRVPRYSFPQSTPAGFGRLQIAFPQVGTKSVEEPLNVLMFRTDKQDFIRVYPGSYAMFHELDEGYYKLIFFYAGSKYHVQDSLYVKPNGLTYYELEHPEQFKSDEFGSTVSSLIEKTIYSSSYRKEDKAFELQQISNKYQEQFVYQGVGRLVDGYVYSSEDGLPIPGVSVIIKGTAYGTTTDIDGYYSLKVPSASSELVFSFVGMKMQEVVAGLRLSIDITLEAESLHMEEVVVVAYGVSSKSSLTASAVTVSANSMADGYFGDLESALAGRVAGVSVSNSSGVPGGTAEIRIRGASSLKFDGVPLFIINGNVYTGDISALDPSLIQGLEVLKPAEAMAIYGSRAANGVVIISTKEGTLLPIGQGTGKGAEFDMAFYDAALQSSSIRNNFSDYAFWQPTLVTDKDGKASFDVTFPDDVTGWETFYLAMNGKRQTGQSQSIIKSFKPLMAQAALPRFLVKGDSTFAIGKVLNYLPDSVEVTTRFEVNGVVKAQATRYCENAVIDSLPIVATDSIEVKYTLEKADGYMDGEQRTIPVYPIGLEQSKGQFYTLDRDTTVRFEFDSTMGSVMLYAKSDMLDVIADEAISLAGYRYACNEQQASKLKALLSHKSICAFKGKTFDGDAKISKLISSLSKNQRSDGLWGWWKDSEPSEWISLHVLEALLSAEKQGYKVSFNRSQAIETMVWELENSTGIYSRIRIMNALKLLGSKINFGEYISRIEKWNNISFTERLHLMELKQLCGIAINLKNLEPFKKQTMYGNVYYTNVDADFRLLENDVLNTLVVYRILRADTTNHELALRKIRNFLLEKRGSGYWRNTYESALVIETILPDLLAGKETPAKPTLSITGAVTKTVTDFPFELNLDAHDNIAVSKTGDFPVYISAYQRFWNPSPVLTKGDFEVKTRFSNGANVLKAGEAVTLIAEVTVKKDAEYVMISIPIPGGCSYADKRKGYKEAHREYFKHETAIFCQKLLQGTYTFEVNLMPRYSGVYTLNPAKVELMYFPTFSANNEVEKVSVK